MTEALCTVGLSCVLLAFLSVRALLIYRHTGEVESKFDNVFFGGAAFAFAVAWVILAVIHWGF